MRLDQPLEYVAGAAQRRFGGTDARDVEPALGVELRVLPGQSPSAVRDHADPAPGPVGDLEDVAQHLHGGEVALVTHGAGVGVLHFVAALFELQDRAADAFEDVERFEPRDDDGDLVLLRERRVLGGPHHAAHVPGGEERLDPAGGGLHDGGDGGRYEHMRDEQ